MTHAELVAKVARAIFLARWPNMAWHTKPHDDPMPNEVVRTYATARAAIAAIAEALRVPSDAMIEAACQADNCGGGTGQCYRDCRHGPYARQFAAMLAASPLVQEEKQ